VALLVEYFELALVLAFYDSDSRRSCGYYGTPQHLAHRHAPKPTTARETAMAVQCYSLLYFLSSGVVALPQFSFTRLEKKFYKLEFD
jgi:hypothetical protein